MREDYPAWLQAQAYADNTCQAQIQRIRKVEDAYGDLAQRQIDQGYDVLIGELTYSLADERSGKPNPSRIRIEGNIRNGLQSYKSAVVRYRTFLTQTREASVILEPSPMPAIRPVPADDPLLQKFSLERDMQASLRRHVGFLEEGLRVVDDGAERSVETGFIDITCRDRDDRLVVVELKAGTADNRAIGQILGYMGDLGREENSNDIRGLLVAHAFDKRTRSAARMLPNVTLVRYALRFAFEVEE
ncbi:endonuclease NucS domain-containing protein [Aurantimonas sp. Leaf443]|uniref:endonuclease NucS domain-containing protein n=1 Tax=Aurantimonas sp. Leaf443 TaxID=1736378 RepID=UPI0006F52CBE|nr:endonuclease NucS domain-containing protein [Aurantimonas sp. Leaf443]KQT87952.1 hypothetical protein ASG48_00345 [Aurantimonas sp. Leaf443]